MGTRRGFTLVDVAVGIAAVGLGCSLVLVGLSESRRSARAAQCAAQLGRIGEGNAQYALANAEHNVGLSWQIGGRNSRYVDLNAQQSFDRMGALAAQAVDFLRRRGRTDIAPIAGWTAPILGWSLPLAEFQDRPLTDPFSICPSDDLRQKWRRNPAAFDAGVFLPLQPAPAAVNKRWPYVAGYTQTAGAFDVNQNPKGGWFFVANRMSQTGNTHLQYTTPGNALLGPSRMSIVSLPSRKVFVFDTHQRHFGGVDLFYAYEASQQPVLHFDGSVRVRVSGDANTTWIGPNPTASGPESFVYTPRAWEPPLANGTYGSETVQDPYRWTRDGLNGWDFAD